MEVVGRENSKSRLPGRVGIGRDYAKSLMEAFDNKDLE